MPSSIESWEKKMQTTRNRSAAASRNLCRESGRTMEVSINSLSEGDDEPIIRRCWSCGQDIKCRYVKEIDYGRGAVIQFVPHKENPHRAAQTEYDDAVNNEAAIQRQLDNINEIPESILRTLEVNGLITRYNLAKKKNELLTSLKGAKDRTNAAKTALEAAKNG